MVTTKNDDKADDAEALLVEASEGAEDWRNQAYTARIRTAQTRRYVGLMKELSRMAVSSTDPKMAAKGAQIQELAVGIIAMGGKL